MTEKEKEHFIAGRRTGKSRWAAQEARRRLMSEITYSLKSGTAFTHDSTLYTPDGREIPFCGIKIVGDAKGNGLFMAEITVPIRLDIKFTLQEIKFYDWCSWRQKLKDLWRYRKAIWKLWKLRITRWWKARKRRGKKCS